MIVADASLIGCFAVRNELSELADAVYERDSAWAAPVLWRSEFRHALAVYLRRGGLTMEAALLALDLAEEAVGGREYQVSSGRVLELAAGSNCAAADCEYAALAGDLGVPLVTADARVLRAFPKTAVSLQSFARKR